MAEKGHQGYADTDEERRREGGREGGHASEERGTSHEFREEGSRRGEHSHTPAHGGGSRSENDVENDADDVTEGSSRSRKTRGGTHDQHVTAGKKGGSRIRQLIELGYKYEQEHGIGPGQNERSKLAAKRRASKSDRTEGGAGAE
jgi:hypothetical protein